MPKRPRRHATARDYPRTARLNRLFQEILAEELELIDDDRLEMVTIMSVDVDGDLRRAVVYYDTLDGADDDVEVQAGLGEARCRLQGAVRRQARLEEVLRSINDDDQ